MTKLYSNEKPKNQRNDLGPKKETVDFLLNYSKALAVKNYKGIESEIILN